MSCRPTGVKLGEGSYSVVIELKLDRDPSVRLAGKVFKTRKSGVKYEIKLTKEIEITVQLDHPNIVASKGVYFQPDATLPVLVMERLMTSLHSYLLDPVNTNLQESLYSTGHSQWTGVPAQPHTSHHPSRLECQECTTGLSVEGQDC